MIEKFNFYKELFYEKPTFDNYIRYMDYTRELSSSVELNPLTQEHYKIYLTNPDVTAAYIGTLRTLDTVPNTNEPTHLGNIGDYTQKTVTYYNSENESGHAPYIPPNTPPGQWKTQGNHDIDKIWHKDFEKVAEEEVVNSGNEEVSEPMKDKVPKQFSSFEKFNFTKKSLEDEISDLETKRESKLKGKGILEQMEKSFSFLSKFDTPKVGTRFENGLEFDDEVFK